MTSTNNTSKSKYDTNRQLFNLPVYLTPEELNAPMALLVNFFEDYNLSEIRGHLSGILTNCITTDEPPFDKACARTELVFFLGRVESVFEAAFVLAKGMNMKQDN